MKNFATKNRGIDYGARERDVDYDCRNRKRDFKVVPRLMQGLR